MLRKLPRLILVLLNLCALMAWSQTVEQPPVPPPQMQAKPQFFAGSVTEISARQITVSRQVAGHSPERRSFLIDSKTKMPRANLHVKSRVTVRYVHDKGGDLALAVKLQPAPQPSHDP